MKRFIKNFIRSINLTAPGVRRIMMKLEDEAVVYKENAGYFLADPLLKQHILRFRLSTATNVTGWPR